MQRTCCPAVHSSSWASRTQIFRSTWSLGSIHRHTAKQDIVHVCIEVLLLKESLSSLFGLPQAAGAAIYTRAPDDVPCSHHMGQVKLQLGHREAGRAYTRLSNHELHDPNHIPAPLTVR